MSLKLLCLEDNEYDAELIEESLKTAEFKCEITQVRTRKEYLAGLDEVGWDAILADYALPGFDGIAALQLAMEKHPTVPFLFISGVLGEDVAVEALKQGACDYVLKSRLARLPVVLRRALREAQLLLAEKQRTLTLQQSLATLEGERQFQMMADTIPLLAFISDAHGYFLWYNRRWYEYTGATPEAMAGWGWQSVHDRAELPRVSKGWQESIHSGKPFEMEYPLRQSDGVFRWFLCRTLPVRADDGSIIRWFATLTDVNEIRQAREVLREREGQTRRLNDELEAKAKERAVQLRESEERYRMLLDNIQDYSIIMLDAEGKVLNWNKSAQRLKQYSAEEIVGKNFSRFHPADEIAAGLPEKLLESAAQKGHVEREGWRTRKDGTLFWGWTLITALRNEDGTLVGFSNMTRDISERKLAEEKLRAQTNSLKQQAEMLNLAPAAIMVRDADSGKIRFWSNGAVETYGYTRDEALGAVSIDLLKTVFPAPFSEVDAELKRTGAWAGELEQTTSTGSKITLASRAALQQGENGEPALILVVNRDVTAQKKAEREIQAMSEQLNVALQAGRVGVWSLDLVENTVSSDDRLPLLFGLPPENRMGSVEVYFERIHPDDIDYVQREIARASQTGVYAVEFRSQWPDGSVHYLASKGEVAYDHEKAVKMTGVCWDITERRATEDLLNTSANRLMLATKAGAVGIWDIDLTTNKLIWDDQMFRLYGTARNQFGGAYEAWQAGLHPDDRERAHATFLRAARGEDSFDTEFRVVWPDGSVRYIRALAQLQFDAKGRPANMVGTNWDITDQRTMENSLLQRTAELEAANAELSISGRKLESNNQELQDFASVAAHDLQEPLRKVRAFGDRLKNDLRGLRFG